MSKATNDQHQKIVLARLTPDMTREQIKRNLIAALERSGFTIHPVEKKDDKGASA